MVMVIVAVVRPQSDIAGDDSKRSDSIHSKPDTAGDGSASQVAADASPRRRLSF